MLVTPADDDLLMLEVADAMLTEFIFVRICVCLFLSENLVSKDLSYLRCELFKI